MYGAESNIEYCLIEDMEEVVSEHIALMNTHNEGLYETWRMNRRSHVEKRRQFGYFLTQFQWSVEHPRLLELDCLRMERQKIIYKRLRGLGWSDADFDFSYSVVKDQWQDLLDRPQVFNDQSTFNSLRPFNADTHFIQAWEKLLFQLVSLLEAKRREPHERKKDLRKEERRKRVYVLLQELKPQINPFRRLLEDLGFDPSQSLNASENVLIILSRLVHYPFPNYATVLEAPCLDDVNNLELTVEEVDRLFYEHQDEIERKITEWREQGEQQLVDLWKEEGRNALSITTGNATTTQLSNTDFLLRADTIFVCHTPGCPGTQLYPKRYPNLVKERSFYHKYYELPSKMIWMKHYRHFEAEKVTKAILGRHEMPDAMYYELEVKGAAFVCERCEHKEPQTWDEMLEHYIYEGKIWHQQTQQDPIVKTSVPVTILYTHDPTVTLNPFIHIIDDEDKDKPTVPPTLIDSEPLDCLLCKNRHHRRTLENLEGMKRHLLNVHKISTVWGDIMYEPSSYGGRFDEGTSKREKAWRCQWDSYSRMYL
ncbi:hypothetical protein BDV93DRAFT_193992 [Ceratobasidium sp. AG-I]|nr:hypothetical protein BDV93DRAFT_193992 [Ceratobasidium sp. AG-I]